jgi:SpoVK/Ycf46/Vps4 family AAA+-type ATPase
LNRLYKVHHYYNDGWEQIQDELRLLDVRLHAQVQVLRCRFSQNSTNTDKFRGIVVSDDQIDDIFNNNPVLSKDHRLNELLGEIKILETQIAEKTARSADKDIYLPLSRLTHVFGLSRFEVQCIVIGLAPELDHKYETVYAYLNDDVTKPYPTVYLVLALLGLSTMDVPMVHSYFEPHAPLPKYIFKSHDNRNYEKSTFISAGLKLDKRIFNFLLGSDRLDYNLLSFTEVVNPGAFTEPDLFIEEPQRLMRDYLRESWAGENTRDVFYLHGPAGSGRKSQVKSLCAYFNRILFIVDLRLLLIEENSFKDNIKLLEREIILQNAVLCFDNFELLLEETGLYRKLLMELLSLIRSINGVTFLVSSSPWKPQKLLEGLTFIDIKFNVPGESERRKIWEREGSKHRYSSIINWGELASKFRYTPGQVKNALSAAHNLALYRKPEKAIINLKDIYQACYSQASHHLEKKSTKISPRYNLDDIIIPSTGKQLLLNICNQVKYKHIVYGDWGFDKKLAYGKGLSVIFTGPPGTGKTMAAQIIAGELSLEMYKIDLSQVMSKYIGETEKNLQEIFNEAELSNAVLFFDEADALFGKRSEVKDARDRYANIETAYLLQKMEEYEGITILATNLMGNIDDAFMRRLQFVVEFPFPNVKYREKIWRSVFPQETPIDSDVDFQFLAEKFELSGGNIKNMAIAAAFFAAEQGSKIRMEHIVRAAKYELRKTGKIFLKENMEEYVDV